MVNGRRLFIIFCSVIFITFWVYAAEECGRSLDSDRIMRLLGEVITRNPITFTYSNNCDEELVLLQQMLKEMENQEKPTKQIAMPAEMYKKIQNFSKEALKKKQPKHRDYLVDSPVGYPGWLYFIKDDETFNWFITAPYIWELEQFFEKHPKEDGFSILNHDDYEELYAWKKDGQMLLSSEYCLAQALEPVKEVYHISRFLKNDISNP